MSHSGLIPIERITRSILLLRGERVLLDSVLADLYQVELRVLNQAVRRNRERFPADFMFQLTRRELTATRSQSVIKWEGRAGHANYRPYAFTEQGVAMLASVLSSARAIRVSVEIVRAFVRLRHLMESNADLARKLSALEKRYDAQFRVVFQAIRELMEPPARVAKRIGFQAMGPVPPRSRVLLSGRPRAG